MKLNRMEFNGLFFLLYSLENMYVPTVEFANEHATLISIPPKASLKAFLLFRIDKYPIWERILITSGDGGDMILVSIHNSDDLHRCLLEGRLHGPAHFNAVGLTPWSSNNDLYAPFFPADFFFRLSAPTKTA